MPIFQDGLKVFLDTTAGKKQGQNTEFPPPPFTNQAL